MLPRGGRTGRTGGTWRKLGVQEARATESSGVWMASAAATYRYFAPFLGIIAFVMHPRVFVDIVLAKERSVGASVRAGESILMGTINKVLSAGEIVGTLDLCTGLE